MSVSESAQITAVRPARSEKITVWKTVVVLFKLRVVSLLWLSSLGGAALGIAAGGAGSWRALGLLTITGIMAAAGASAINQYLELEQDQKMRRTAFRPLAAGQIRHPILVFMIGSFLVLAAVAIALAAGNPSLAGWLLVGALIYVGVYTLWLKPRTVLNIVIGGAAGSCAVISGGAAVGVPLAVGVWLLAALVFVWTPVHFWALALAYREDYATAGFPMLPAVIPAVGAARWTAAHTLLTAGFGVTLGLVPEFDWLLTGIVFLTTLPLITRTIALLIKPDRSTALPLFLTSNVYLTVVLLAVMGSLLWR